LLLLRSGASRTRAARSPFSRLPESGGELITAVNRPAEAGSLRPAFGLRLAAAEGSASEMAAAESFQPLKRASASAFSSSARRLISERRLSVAAIR